MKQLFFLLVLVFNCLLGVSQTRGVIVDSVSRNPVEFATITYQGQMRGTITNENGQFVLDGTYNQDTLLISHLNYETKKIPFSNLASDNSNMPIFLTPTIYQVEEIKVVADQIPNLLAKAIDRSKKKLVHNFLANTYIREFVKEGENYTKFSDGLIDFYVDNFQEKSSKMSVLVSQSRAFELNTDDESTFDVISPLDIRDVFSLGNPDHLVRFVNDKEYYNFSITEKISKEGIRSRIISFQPKNESQNPSCQYKGYVVINPENQLLYEYSIELVKPEIQEIKNLLIFKGQLKRHSYSAKFNSFEDNYYPVFTSQNIGLNIWNKKNVDAQFDFKSDCLIRQIERIPDDPISKKENFKKKSLFKLGNNYSGTFWKNQGVFSLTEKEKMVVEKLAKSTQTDE
ncbi:carboxypeptidase-like regulatory domain-containing protein [Geofilum sp. OHC36d9]|uniref:carboxypeptidase-like regulatory domain-containing protein n=1 Tax=Geofilum sp. OHC36d9 TaxID=3458413 RepID=UPI00403489BD